MPKLENYQRGITQKPIFLFQIKYQGDILKMYPYVVLNDSIVYSM